MLIDLGPAGPSGIEAKYNDGVLYIRGSDHMHDWLHHVIPGAKRREEQAAIELHNYIVRHELPVHTVAGHSLGGPIALKLSYLFRANYTTVRCFLYGPKRAPKSWHTPATVYRHRGDIVPFLPPWRRRYQNTELIGNRLPLWKAHGPNTYWDRMEADGVR